MKPQALLKGAGIALFLIGVVWSSIVGFTLSQLPVLLGTLLAAAACLFVAGKMDPATKIDTDDDVEQSAE